MNNTINNYTKEEAINLAFKLGFEGENKRHSCSQASYNAISTVLGIKNTLFFKSLSALEGGGANTTQNSCGAFCGGLVIFSYYFGRDYDLWEKEKTDITSSLLGQKLYNRFVEKWGTAICKDMQKQIYGFETDFMDEFQFKRFEDAGGHSTGCPTVVGLASAWTIDIIWDELIKDKDLSNIPDMKDIDAFFPPKEAEKYKKK